MVGVGLMSWILVEQLRGISEVFSSSSALRVGLLGLTLIVIGVQLIFGSFFLSLLHIKVRN